MQQKPDDYVLCLDKAKKAYLDGNYQKSAILFKKILSQDDPEVYFYLGFLCLLGVNFQEREHNAIYFFNKSASLGYLPAKYKIREIHNKNVSFLLKSSEKSCSVSQSQISEKIELLKVLAMQGELEAMYELGCSFISVSKPDYTSGAFWFGKAAQKGHPRAQKDLGILYLDGKGVKRDVLQSVLWLKRSAEQGVIDSIYLLAEIYCDSKNEFFDLQEGLSLLMKIKHQNTNALLLLSKILQDETLGVLDREKAEEYLKLAIECGEYRAYYELGKLYISQKKYEEGLSLLLIATDNNNVEAILLLSLILYNGTICDKDEEKAAFLLNKSSEFGDLESQFLFASILKNTNNQALTNKAKYWYKKSADLGYFKSAYEYSMLLIADADKILAKYKINVGDELNEDNKEVYYAFSLYETAFTYLLKSASNGHEQSEYQLYYMYNYGLGVKKDKHLAIEWCTRSAEHGNVDAQLKMAQMYDNGEFVDVNINKAIEWYKSSAKLNNLEAIYSLGMMYINGRGVQKDLQEGICLLEKSASLKYPQAMYQLGVCYLNGIGVSKDEDKAEKLFDEASKNGEENAIIALANIYINNSNKFNNIGFAIELLQKHVQQGSDSCMQMLSKLYFNGYGVDKDIDYSIELLKKASEKNNRIALYDLGVMYLEGRFVLKNYNQAIQYIKHSAELNYDKALYMLGVCYRDGVGVLENYKVSFDYFKKAADMNYDLAILAIGQMYEKGLGVMRNYQLALDYYIKLASCDFDEAYILISRLYLYGSNITIQDYQLAKEWLEKGVLRKNSACCYELALLHINKKLNDSNYSRGMELMTSSADGGYSEAQYYLAKDIMDKDYNEENALKAINYLKNASSQNHLKATTLLGKIYRYGYGGMSNNLLAADLLINSAKRGDHEAQFEVAKLFRNGDGVPYSIVDAYIWSVLAVSNHSSRKEVKKFRDELAVILTPSQILEAQQIAAEYCSKYVEL